MVGSCIFGFLTCCRSLLQGKLLENFPAGKTQGIFKFAKNGILCFCSKFIALGVEGGHYCLKKFIQCAMFAHNTQGRTRSQMVTGSRLRELHVVMW